MLKIVRIECMILKMRPIILLEVTPFSKLMNTLPSLSLYCLALPTDSIQESKWDHIWIERWLLFSWLWSEGTAFVHFPEPVHNNGMSSLNPINIIWTMFGFYTQTLTLACSRNSRSVRRTVCFRLTRVQSGTPTVCSHCSGKYHVLQ